MRKASKRAKNSSAFAFLDLEAQVDNSSEEEEQESEDDDGFVIRDKPVTSAPIPRVLSIFTMQEEVTRLEQIAMNIRERYSGHASASDMPVSTLTDVVNNATLQPSMQDPQVWRLSTEHGHEHDILIKCMDLSFAAPHDSPVISIFHRDHEPCAVYFEIRPSGIDAKMLLESILKGIAPVTFLGSNKSRLSFVSPKDRANLLMCPHQATQCDRGSWVRLRRGGRYHNDLGFVMRMDGDNAETIWVPRIPLDSNFRSRPPTALFDHDAIKDVKGTRAVRHCHGFYKFQGKTYTQDGFLSQSVDRLYLDVISVLPSEKELAFFSRSHNREVLQAVQAARSRVDYNVFDRVRVHSGPLQGTLARVVSIKDADVVTIETLLETVVIDVSRENIRKAFSCGDLVTVIQGEYQGEEGFIIDVHGTLVTLYIARFIKDAEDRVGEVQVDESYINWKNNVHITCHAEEQSTSDDRPLKDPMHTGDPFRGMNVRIIKGNLKSHQGTVLGSTLVLEGKFSISVRTNTQVVKTIVELCNEDVVELTTGLTLSKARWLPRNCLPTEPDRRPSTPPHPSASEVPSAPAWDPASRLPGESHVISSKLKQGEWLLDPRLVDKRIDVVIEGTMRGLYYRAGKYEGRRGVLVLRSPAKELDSAVTVKLGLIATQVKFPLKYILPESTTEREGAVNAPQSKLIHTVLGQRVVIIGKDLSGSMDFIGSYGSISPCQYPLQPQESLVFLFPPVNKFVYFHSESICRSHHESVFWDDAWIP